MDCKTSGLLFTLVACFLLQIRGVTSNSEEDSLSPGCPAFLSNVRNGHTAVHNHVCYLFVNKEEHWRDAQSHCYDLGGEMLSIENEETMKFIAKSLNSKELGWNRNGVWTGLKLIDSVWQWTNGRKMSYEHWAHDEPSQILEIFSVENCVLMRRVKDWRWHDYPCNSLKFHYNYICEFPLSKPSDSESQVAPSAASQEDDNGNTFILIIIIGLGAGILALLLVIAGLLHVHHRRSKRRRAELPVRYSNNPNNHNHQSSSTYSSNGSGSNGSSIPVCAIPTGAPPAPPTDSENTSSSIYSEVKPRGSHLQAMTFPAQQQGNGGPATSTTRGLGYQRNSSSQHDELERTPLMMSSSIPSDLLLGSDQSVENTVAPQPVVAAIAESQPATMNGSANLPSAGDYIDMNSLITKERHGQLEAQANRKKEADVPDEDKHVYTNVDHRTEKAENLYETMP